MESGDLAAVDAPVEVKPSDTVEIAASGGDVAEALRIQEGKYVLKQLSCTYMVNDTLVLVNHVLSMHFVAQKSR